MTDEPSETPAINFVDHIAEADARVIAEAEKILDVSGTAIFRARLGKVVGDTHHPFPPPAERVVAALPPMLRDVDNARLPVSYQNATAALQQCCLVDECWEAKPMIVSDCLILSDFEVRENQCRRVVAGKARAGRWVLGTEFRAARTVFTS
jgi:hypothetical protein